MMKYIAGSIFLCFIFTAGISFAQQQRDQPEALERFVSAVQAQYGDSVRYHTNHHGELRAIYGTLSDVIPDSRTTPAFTLDFLTTHRAVFNLDDPEAELEPVSAQVDGFGLEHLTFRQLFRGIPVFERGLTVHINAERRIHSITTNYVPDIRVENTTPAYDTSEALQRTKALENVTETLHLENADLVIFCHERSGKHSLAYRVLLAGDGIDKTIILDARRGGKIAEYPNRKYQGDGPTSGSGTNAFGQVDHALPMYRGINFPRNASLLSKIRGIYNEFTLIDLECCAPRDPNKNLGNIFALNGNASRSFSTTDYVSNNTRDFPNTNVGQAAVSGLQNFEATLAYYKTRHGRRGIDNAGMPIIHIQNWLFPDGPNAFWSSSLNFMAFYIGDATYRPWSAALDVVAHELTHGVTDKTSDLAYENLSGALNESISDIFGYLVESFEMNVYDDWLIGQNLWRASGHALRSFENPPAYYQPDKLFSEDWIPPINPNKNNDWGGVHTNSGVSNKVFYLLVNGGTFSQVGVQPFDNNLDASAALVADLYYLVNTGGYFHQNTTFSEARAAMMAAVQAVYPNDPARATSVNNAWSAVLEATLPSTFVMTDNTTITAAQTYKGTEEIRLNSGTSVSVNSGGKLTLLSGDHILLQGEFTAASGSELSFYAVPY